MGDLGCTVRGLPAGFRLWRGRLVIEKRFGNAVHQCQPLLDLAIKIRNRFKPAQHCQLLPFICIVGDNMRLRIIHHLNAVLDGAVCLIGINQGLGRGFGQ